MPSCQTTTSMKSLGHNQQLCDQYNCYAGPAHRCRISPPPPASPQRRMPALALATLVQQPTRGAATPAVLEVRRHRHRPSRCHGSSVVAVTVAVASLPASPALLRRCRRRRRRPRQSPSPQSLLPSPSPPSATAQAAAAAAKAAPPCTGGRARPAGPGPTGAHCPVSTPRAVMNILHPCNPKPVCCCIQIAI